MKRYVWVMSQRWRYTEGQPEPIKKVWALKADACRALAELTEEVYEHYRKAYDSTTIADLTPCRFVVSIEVDHGNGPSRSTIYEARVYKCEVDGGILSEIAETL